MARRSKNFAPLLFAASFAVLMGFAPQAARARQTPPTTPPTNPPAKPQQLDIPRDPQSSFEPRTGPGAGQKLMEKMAGDWLVVKSIFPVGKPPVRTNGTCKQTMVNDGRFLRSEFSFDNPATGGKDDGVGLLGYDPKADKFTSVWYDSRSTTFSFRQSVGKFDGEQVLLVGKSLDSATPARVSRTVARLENNNNLLLHQQFVPTPDGKERLVMELRMTRRATPPAQKTATNR